MMIRVNVDSPSEDIEYANLSKSSVTGIKSILNISQLISRCVKSGLKKIQNKFRSQFQSVEDFEYKQAVSRYIPVIAYNLAQVAGRVESVEVRDKIRELVDADVEVRVKDELIKLIGLRRRKDEVEELF